MSSIASSSATALTKANHIDFLVASPSVSPKRKVHMKHWKIVATTGHTVSLIGAVGTQYVQTTPICLARPGEVQTENTHYILGKKQPGLWELQLQLKRPDQVANLKKHGVL